MFEKFYKLKFEPRNDMQYWNGGSPDVVISKSKYTTGDHSVVFFEVDGITVCAVGYEELKAILKDMDE